MIRLMKIKQQQGVAVITVILIVALLTTLMAYAAESQLMLVRRVTNQNMLEQSYQLALGGEQWISTILQEVTESRNKEAFNVNQDNRQKIIDSGGVVRSLDAAQRAEWVAALKPVWQKFEGDIGADIISAAEASNN